MPLLATNDTCCGCNACFAACSRHCIAMTPDAEGFLHPVVDSEQCVECGACTRACPVINIAKPRQPIRVYAAQAKDEIRLNSSSGGISPLLAAETISRKGVVWGVAWDFSDINPVAKFRCASTHEELEAFRSSKYVQAEIGNSYNVVKQQLVKGTIVLFSGTPCQIAGLRSFLKKDYPTLTTAEVICHAAPSPKVFNSYLNEIKKNAVENEVGKNTVLLPSLKAMPTITGINFREKKLNGFSWKKFGFVVKQRSPVKGDKNSVLLSNIHNYNPFMRAFLEELCNRPSCHDCKFKQLKSGADITMGDFWKITELMPEIDDDKGTSIITVNSDKGNAAFESIKSKLAECREMTYEMAIDSTRALVESPKAHPKRAQFFEMYPNVGIEKTVETLLRPPLTKRIWFKLLDIQYRIKHLFY